VAVVILHLTPEDEVHKIFYSAYPIFTLPFILKNMDVTTTDHGIWSAMDSKVTIFADPLRKSTPLTTGGYKLVGYQWDRDVSDELVGTGVTPAFLQCRAEVSYVEANAHSA
jgi:hypothetical protein